MLYLTHAFPIIDTDRLTPTNGGGGRVSARVWLALGFILWVAVWAFLRLNDYFRG
jgi:hypothetical protein